VRTPIADASRIPPRVRENSTRGSGDRNQNVRSIHWQFTSGDDASNSASHGWSSDPPDDSGADAEIARKSDDGVLRERV